MTRPMRNLHMQISVELLEHWNVEINAAVNGKCSHCAAGKMELIFVNRNRVRMISSITLSTVYIQGGCTGSVYCISDSQATVLIS